MVLSGETSATGDQLLEMQECNAGPVSIPPCWVCVPLPEHLKSLRTHGHLDSDC